MTVTTAKIRSHPPITPPRLHGPRGLHEKCSSGAHTQAMQPAGSPERRIVGKLFLATVLAVCSRKLLAAPTSDHPNAELAADAIKMAVAVRGGADQITDVIFHTDRGRPLHRQCFHKTVRSVKIRQSIGRVGSCCDTAVAESLFSTLEWEVLSRHRFRTKDEARQVISAWVEDSYNARRRHATAGIKSPIEFEKTLTIKVIAA